MTDQQFKSTARGPFGKFAETAKRIGDRYGEPLRKFYNKWKDRDIVYLIPFVLFSLYIRLRYFFFLYRSEQGFPVSDDSKWYLNYAYSFLEHFNIGLSMNDVLYFGYNMLLAALLAVFKSPVAVIFIQTVTAGLCVIFVYKIARMLFNRITAIIASYFYSYHLWGITLWSSYILSDSFFISLSLVSVFLLLKFMQTNKKVYKFSFIASALYLLVFRPTGVVTVFFMVIYIVIHTQWKTLMKWAKTYGLAIGGAAVALIVAYMAGKLDPLVASIQYNAKLVLYNVYAFGKIYDNVSPYDHHYKPDYTIDVMDSLVLSFFVHNWDHILVIYAKRAIAFLGRWVWATDLSSAAGIRAFIVHLLPTVLFLIATVASIVNGLFKKASIVWLLVFTAFVFCVMLFIDGMYRYKAPALPYIAIVAAYGADRVIHAAWLAAKSAVALVAGWLSRRKKTHYSPDF